MERNEELAQEVRALRERLSRLAQASLRINESLDFDTVLQGVLDSAQSLTGARYGVITLLDGSGELESVLFSGVTGEEARLFRELPQGLQLFQYLSGLSQPLRVPDLLAHLRSMGLPDLEPPVAVGPAVPFLAVPVQHRGERVGNFFLAKTEPPDSQSFEFSPEDQETLVMFASQAALVVANARRHREEREARRTRRPWSTPRRWAWSCSMPGPGRRCPSTRRPGASWTNCGSGASRPSNSWR